MCAAQASAEAPEPFDLALFEQYLIESPTVVAVGPQIGLQQGSSTSLTAGIMESTRQSGRNLAATLHEQFVEWRGTPHRMGGTDRSGIDCSALVRHIFSTYFGMELPRASRDQSKQGISVPRKDLKPGDLVFFKSGPSGRHVGIYVADGKFLHTSSMIGVTISSMDEKYWNKRFVTARRIPGIETFR
jgi:hypothetical protein